MIDTPEELRSENQEVGINNKLLNEVIGATQKVGEKNMIKALAKAFGGDDTPKNRE